MALRLDYVSPLPPVRSGIADYSCDLLPELASRCDLRVARLPGQEVSSEVAGRYPAVVLEEAGAAERLPLYQVGNNLYHQAVVGHALARPGVVTLHDLCLHHLLMERTLRHHDLDGYVRALVADHGWVGSAVALPPRWGGFGQAGLFALPAQRTLLERQRGVLVHGSWAKQELEAEGLSTPVRVVPMPMPVPRVEPDAGLAARLRLGLPSEAFVIGSFGFQTPIKRTAAVVRALSRPGLERVHLLVVGEPSPGIELAGIAREEGVAGRVHVLGFVPGSEYTSAVLACDVCANLRHPTAGETSASLLRLFAVGRGAVVSDYGQFAELPPEVSVRTPLPAVAAGGDEIEALAVTLRALVETPERCRSMGEAARRLVVERHDPGRAADAIVEACGELAALPGGPRDGGSAWPDRAPPTSLSWGVLRGSIEVSGLSGWEAGARRTLVVTLRNAGCARWLTPESREGGVALECRIETPVGEEVARLPWVPLSRVVEPGEALELELTLRRPPGEATLRLLPQVIGGPSFASLGGPVFEHRLGARPERGAGRG
jgi:glycosyltransferase involved in cell wall biosynthesis